jgi:hypothetical protein
MLFQNSLMFVRKGKSLTYSGAPEWQAPAILANIKLGWKDLPGTNTLAY